ncbi:MAG: trehalose-phosphatase [Phyllobacterium sp.]
MAEALPTDLNGWALFIDIDGTLIDLAPTPTSIEIPPELSLQLLVVSERAAGALALVTGRSIEAVDAMFYPQQFAVAGMHGAEIRSASGALNRKQIDRMSFAHARAALTELAGHWPGLIVEDKGLAIAVHYRQNPGAADAVHARMTSLQAELGREWKLQRGKMVVELHPSGVGKGAAMAGLMADAPFKGKKPLAIGDDLTDEAMFDVANRCDGRSVRVGESAYESAARFKVGSAAEVRRWVAGLAKAGRRPSF